MKIEKPKKCEKCQFKDCCAFRLVLETEKPPDGCPIQSMPEMQRVVQVAHRCYGVITDIVALPPDMGMLRTYVIEESYKKVNEMFSGEMGW